MNGATGSCHQSEDCQDSLIVRLAALERDDDDDDIIQMLTDMINAAYKVGEDGILVDSDERPFLRMTRQDVRDMVEAEKLLVLYSATTTSGETSTSTSSTKGELLVLVGCVKVEAVSVQEDPDDPISGRMCGEWGCLAVLPSSQRQGYGRRLVSAAEDHARHTLGCSHIQLELLAPSDWKHAHKEMLREWYTARLGYQLKFATDYDKSTHRLPANELLGDKFLLATNADFTTYRKELA